MQAYLPPHSDRPLHLGEEPTLCLKPVLQLLESLRDHLQTRPLGAAQLAEQWRAIAAQLACYESAYRHDPARRHLGETVRWQRGVWFNTEEHDSPELMEHYRVYDAHFGIMRMDAMTRSELAHQCLSTLRRTADDLPDTLLTREHHRTLVDAFATMLSMVFPACEGERPETRVELEAMDPISGRWRNGHHLFGLCCCMGRESLHQAGDAILADHLEEACQAVGRASLFLAASTAAMVYTSDLPSFAYRNTIRPAMPEGFSGSHNSDFNHLKQLKGKLHVVAMKRWGLEPDGWPQPLVAALRHFRDTDLLDLDQHILIAAANIGFGLSLKQHAGAQADSSAIGALRRMADARKKDFRLG
ncbi:MAG: hypothetical protein J0I12_08095 [Candidatus Eremiobacteraeota bacterium]|nr:hypothetical protein [Candidatus Eremiobacteraeota bacterium]